MKILFLAPHPFYQDRGTPIAVDLLVGVLAEQGHRVDVLTYHEGENRAVPDSVRIYRIPEPPRCRNIRPGFSLKKLRADIGLYREAVRMAARGDYDVVHAVEESVFIAMALKRKFRLPYICDMDSSMPVQMADALPLLRPVLPVMRHCEGRAIRGALAVAAVCDALAEIARNQNARRVFLLRDVPLTRPARPDSPPRGFRKELGLEGETCILYIGNLEKYQGIDLLLNAFARLPNGTAAHLAIVGGIPAHIEQYRARTEELGIRDRVHWTGPRPVEHLSALMAEADILVSPRTQGQNTPMKIYSYMAAGKAILATDLPTHTQVLTPDSAKLAAPEDTAFAQALHELIDDARLRETLGKNARALAETRYSLDAFKQSVAALYDWVEKER